MRYAIGPLPPGEPGIWLSVEAMRRAVAAEIALPIVRDAGAAIVRGCHPHAARCKAARILAFLRARLEYVPDPQGVEALALPSVHLQRIEELGRSYGDCDDGAVLGATLARTVGMRARFVVASFMKSKRLHHVWSEAAGNTVGPPEWNEMDPYRAERFAGRATRLEFVDA